MSRARTLMIQGTASFVGKSLVTAALCRYFKQTGLRVAPFKAQNMALNSFVTPDGLEIGRAQAAQAEACGIPPQVEMNPVLLKCETDQRVQVVVLGKSVGSMSGADYYDYSPKLKPIIAGALEKLRDQYDLVVLEGAGSPAEVNLTERDLANRYAARLADGPVLLVGDIDRGGVFAALWGTLELMPPEDRARVKGLVINKFRGNAEILRPGLEFIKAKAGLPVLGVLPFEKDVVLAEEDSVALESPRSSAVGAVLEVAVIRFPHISNSDDFQPLERERAVRVSFVEKPEALEGVDLVILPGTKTTVADLKWLRLAGFEDALKARAQRGAPILGLCGGYQMMGGKIEDPEGVESTQTSTPGLGLLPVETFFEAKKKTAQVEARPVGQPWDAGQTLQAYEIHSGRVVVSPGATAMFETRSTRGWGPEGVAQENLWGTLLHGIFEDDGWRRGLLDYLAGRKGVPAPPSIFGKEEGYDQLAEMIRSHLDTKLLRLWAGLKGNFP